MILMEKWAVEGEGISPDIEVIQDPQLVLQGRDPQFGGRGERGSTSVGRQLI